MMKFELEYEIRIKSLKSQFLACKQWELYCVDNDIEPAAASMRLTAMQDEYAKELHALQAFVTSNFNQFDARNVSSLIAVPTQLLSDDEKVMHRIWLGSHLPPMVKESIRQWGCALDEIKSDNDSEYQLALWVWDKRQLQDDPLFKSAREPRNGDTKYAIGSYTVGTQNLVVNCLHDLAIDFSALNVDLIEGLYAKRYFVNLSDVFRLVILREFGGIYLDADTMPYRPATIFLSKPEVPDYIYYQVDRRSDKIHQCHVSWMNLHKDENGMLIARKGNPALKKMTAQINDNLLKISATATEKSYYSIRSKGYASALHASALHDATYGVWQQYIGRTFLSYDDITRSNSILHDGKQEAVCGGLRGLRLTVDAITNEKIPLDSEEQRAYDKCVAELEKRDWRLDDVLDLENLADVFFLEEVPRMAYPPQLRSQIENCQYYSFLSDEKCLDRINLLFSDYLMKKNAKRIASGNFWHKTSGCDRQATLHSVAPGINSGAIEKLAVGTSPASHERNAAVSFLPGDQLDEKYKDRMAKLLFATSYLEYCSFDNKLKLPLVALQRRQNIDQYISSTFGMFDHDRNFIGFFTAATMEEFARVQSVSHYRDEMKPMDEAYDEFVSNNTEANDLYVSSLAIDDAQKGKGFFNSMFAEIKLLARQKGSRRIVLTVWGKSDAFQIYVKKGFKLRSTFDYAYEKFFDRLYLMEYEILPQRVIEYGMADERRKSVQRVAKVAHLSKVLYS